MVKPWMGITPPPYGQGYYPNETPNHYTESATGGYVSPYAPPPTSQHVIGMDWQRLFDPEVRYEPRVADYGVAIDKFVNDKLSETIRVEEELVTDAVIVLLRQKGYTVIEPKGEDE